MTSAFAHGRHGGRGVSLTINDDFGTVTDCSGLEVTFDGERVPVVTEEVPVGALSSLRVRTLENGGGVYVTGASGSRYTVRLCKAAMEGLNANQVRAAVRGNEISVEGPDRGRWVGYFIISAPRGADLDIEASNGPIKLDRVNGRVNARAVNGPISVKDSSGDLDVSTQNGPISLSGGSGDVKATASNGPLSVRLTGSAWHGNLEARTQNGPLTVRLPRNYGSGVLVESRGHGPVSCRAEGCFDRGRSRSRDDDRDDWHRERRFELGSGPQNVKLSTVNGPLSIKDSD